MNDRKEESIQTTILGEYERLRRETFAIDARNVRILSISASLTALLAGYGIKEGKSEVFLACPFIIYGIVFYILYYAHQMMVRHGYMIALEDEINRLLGKDILLWESFHVDKFIMNAISAVTFNLILFFLNLGIIIYSHWRVFVKYPGEIFLVHLVFSILLFGWTLIIIYKTSKAHECPKKFSIERLTKI